MPSTERNTFHMNQVSKFNAIMRRLDAIVKYLGIPDEIISPPGRYSVVWRDGVILLECRSYADCVDYLDTYGDSFTDPPRIVPV